MMHTADFRGQEKHEDWLERLLTPAELSAALAVGLRTIRRLTKCGAIPCTNIGGRRPRYNLGDVLAALNTDDGSEQGE